MRKCAVIRQFIPDCERAMVLEIGCGLGNLTIHLHQHIRDLHAIDVSMTSLRHVRNLLPAVMLYEMAVEQMGFKTGSFDAIIGSGILHHTNIKAALTEIERVLSPGGRFVFFEPNLDFVENYLINNFSLFRNMSTLSEDEYHFTREYISREFGKHQFKGVAVGLFFTPHPRLHGIAQPFNLLLNRLFEKIQLSCGSRELLITGSRA